MGENTIGVSLGGGSGPAPSIDAGENFKFASSDNTLRRFRRTQYRLDMIEVMARAAPIPMPAFDAGVRASDVKVGAGEELERAD